MFAIAFIAASLGACPDALASPARLSPGDRLPLLQALPFAGLILSMALGQSMMPRFWHKHERSIVAFWGVAAIGGLALHFGGGTTGIMLLTTTLHDYLPFVILLTTLYTVAGGIRIVGHLHGSPLTNLTLIGIGTLMASLIGTTGAAMVMIRPLIRANEERIHKAHVVIFFIFLVANVGGALTPLGDPPLLIGYLNGVDFFWPTQYLAGPMAMVTGLLAMIFLALDRHYYHLDEMFRARINPQPYTSWIEIESWGNIALMLAIVAIVPTLGAFRSDIGIDLFGVHVGLTDVIRDCLLIGIMAVSLVVTPKRTRSSNGFTWRPMVEVATVFAGIFIALIPVEAMLGQGRDGAFLQLINLVTHVDGTPDVAMYFWLSGLLSGLLDNAPTYLAFFHLAGGDARSLMETGTRTLMAISCGCVFMGAMTYIGNAPNMLVRSVARHHRIEMPGFFGYIAWSGSILVPVFGLVTLVFFR